AETNDVTNSVFESRTIQNEFVTLSNEAKNNGALNPDGSISLAHCGTWTAGLGQVVDCVELSRAEKRFGNGDGTYTVAEQTAALNTYYQQFDGPYVFNGTPRQVRFGFELAF
ncbi:MAG TPA: hypothetical protein VH113_02575, partial [Gemmatimonadales bacterium]|nr:hypothetical protein [Gemmatimonadales bacterium]